MLRLNKSKLQNSYNVFGIKGTFLRKASRCLALRFGTGFPWTNDKEIGVAIFFSVPE